MLDDGGSGQAVEVITVSEDAEVTEGLHVQGSLASSPQRTPRSPGSPGVLATAHVRTRVRPPPGGLGGTYSIVRRFEFSAEKQRNTVVVRKPDGSLHAMTKGSPEMMRKLAGAVAGGEGGGSWESPSCLLRPCFHLPVTTLTCAACPAPPCSRRQRARRL